MMKASRRILTAAILGAAFLFLGISPLAAQQGNGYLKVHTNTGRAGVFIDGKYVGPAANFRFTRKYTVPAGEHDVKLIDPRFEEYSTKVTITAGKTTVLSQDLKALPEPKPPFGMLRTDGGPDKFAAVYVNDHYMGHVDEFSNYAQRLLLPPGDYTVRIVSPTTGKEQEEKVKIEADKTTTIEVKL